ncbi:MAG TPA: TetR/AcrR family transcriptional regulator [Solirubrobacteraceae bacterium]|jgi:AcrR family transcriptional regulator|nr:TetR/AcrR family transcriptional regulator [Solirubrobacteraceae bacterium]
MKMDESDLYQPSGATARSAGRMTREQARANTRERLLTAARSVFARSGFHGASVDEIASEAGFSTGALYSNFDGKEDLFLVLMEREIAEHAREIADAVGARESIAERATGGARQWMTMIDREPELLLLFMEFWAYGVRDPDVRPKVAERFAQMRQVITQLIADGAREFDLELALPAEQLALAIDALADGIARQKLADPAAVPDELMGNVLALLLTAATRPAGATRPAASRPPAASGPRAG